LKTFTKEEITKTIKRFEKVAFGNPKHCFSSATSETLEQVKKYFRTPNHEDTNVCTCTEPRNFYGNGLVVICKQCKKPIVMRASCMKIFSGEDSRNMWAEISSAKTVGDLRDTLYEICCKLQELEALLPEHPPNREVAEQCSLPGKACSKSNT